MKKKFLIFSCQDTLNDMKRPEKRFKKKRACVRARAHVLRPREIEASVSQE